MGRRDPLHIGDILLRERVRAAPETRLAKLQAIWVDLVGEEVAANCSPVGERDGCVDVGCSSSVWAQELSIMKPEMLARLGGDGGVDWVKDLRFSVSR